ncbi:MAG: Hsp70 family protein [Prevotellaceae bacterium]|jgi:molecular chaperone DnaK (HSP70)|nr:Hsp70 family protein [Prevotellaceae bacterium]
MNHIDPVYKLSEGLYSSLKKAVKGILSDKETRSLIKAIVIDILQEHGVADVKSLARQNETIFGIDFGSVSSRVAYVDDAGEIVITKNFNGSSSTPSVVYFVDDVRAVVGYDARVKSVLEPERTVSLVKRALADDSAYEGASKFYHGLNPTKISTYIFKKLIVEARDMLHHPELATRAVLTCPACFGTKERERLREACEGAGIKVLAVINEPTATAMSYGIKADDEKTVLVYDLGGASFHVSVVRASEGFISVIAAGGDRHIGGIDWDISLSEYLIERYNKKKDSLYKLDRDVRLKNAMLILAEKVKKQLTFKPRTSMVVSPFLWGGEDDPVRMVVTREIFEGMTEHLLDETIKKTHEILADSREKGVGRIDEVLLAGGSAFMPQVKARIDRELNCEARLEYPDECVARGAAIYAMQWCNYNPPSE